MTFKNKIEVVYHNVGSFGYKQGLVREIINKEYNKKPNWAGEQEKVNPQDMAIDMTM